jgi:hypothetical protein
VTNPTPSSWLQKALGIATTLLAIGLLLHWTWDLLRPLVPVFIAVVSVVTLSRIAWSIYRFRRSRW